MDETTAAVLSILLGLITLVFGGEFLVRGASRLAAAVKISPLVIGLTVVAFGTSAPELAVSLQSAFAGNADIAVGNAVGSNIFNVLFILGAAAVIVPLTVASRLVRLDVPLMIGASVVLWILGFDGRLGRLDGCGLFAALLGYTYWCIRQSRRESTEVQSEFEEEFPAEKASSSFLIIQIGLIVGGLVLLGIGAQLLINGSVAIATRMGISELVIGLTIVSVGTSLPEVITSLVAAWKGERDIAVGNVVGSNIFNILCVLGLTSIVAPAGVTISPEALWFDIPVMIAVAVACLPIFFTGNVITRWEGSLFLGYYVAYTTYLVLSATDSPLTATYGTIMLTVVLPVTAITLVVSAYRAARAA